MARYNILFGGAAGKGPNFVANLIAKSLFKRGYYVFNSRDYQSLIRGGHNFNVLTFSDKPVYSNDSEMDILVAIDALTEKLHKKSLKKTGFLLSGQAENMYYAGAIFKLLGFKWKEVQDEIWELGKRYEENLEIAKKGYLEETKSFLTIKKIKAARHLQSGSEGISEGAVRSGLDLYYGYPMTPATPVLKGLAASQFDKNYAVVELENEIAVVHGAIGSALTGAKTMTGTSGGGFDLMTEALSLASMAEVPLVMYLAQRPGPASGTPTYNSQGDLNMARHSGHGEFPRMVLAPGDPKECEELVSHAFYFSQNYKLPVIIISDKHLAESYYTYDGNSYLVKSKKLATLAKYNSYEHTADGISTEEASDIKKNAEARLKKLNNIAKASKKFQPYKLFGNKKSKNIILSWGSTKGAILDSIPGLDVAFLHILYMDPFPTKDIKKIVKNKNIFLIENNSTAQLGQLLSEKTGIFVKDKNKILRYDARPFLCDELKLEIKKRL